MAQVNPEQLARLKRQIGKLAAGQKLPERLQKLTPSGREEPAPTTIRPAA